MASVTEEEQRAARAKVTAALAVFALVLVAVIAGLIWAGQQTAPTAAPAAPGSDAPADAGTGGSGPSAPGAVDRGAGGWDVGAETALAMRVMAQFPDSAALPQTLAAGGGRPIIAVPTATRVNAAGVGEGFPPTVEGAIGQLAALETVGLRDLDPQTYNAAYSSVSLPGAPAPGATPLGAQVASIHSQLVGSTSATPITSRWQLAGAQVKGVTAGGRAAVVCVAGELQAVQERSAEVGTGDCQAMRWTGTDWRIAPVAAAARAPVTWPGSEAFNRAGFHPTTGGDS